MERSDVIDLILMNQIALAATRDGIKDGYIPVWLLVLVLIRLPPKLLFRFKCVCKQWLSIISDPSFVRFYCSHAVLLHPWTFVPSHMQFDDSESSHPPDPKLLADIYSNNFEWPSLHLLSLPSFGQPYGKDYKIYGVSNGLVLYGPLEYHTAIVRLCNPLTGHFITLPPHVFDGEGWDSWGLIANVEDGILVSYVVVHFYVPFRRESSKIFQGEVFLSEIGEWKAYDVHMDVAIRFDPTCACVNLNGNFHWLAQRKWLIAYDPRKYPDQARIIALPGEGTPMNCVEYMTVSQQGQLTYYQQHDGTDENSCNLSIWVLNDYRSGGWYLQHRVSHIDIQFANTRLSEHEKPICPLSVHPYDSDIVYFGYNDMLVSYNIKTEKLEIDVDFGDVLDNISLDSTGWLVMLLFPPWPISLSRPALKD